MQIVTDGFARGVSEKDEKSHSPSEIGIAVDIGTTTVVAATYIPHVQKPIAVAAAGNEQLKYGYDVIHRISFAIRRTCEDSGITSTRSSVLLHQVLINQIEKLMVQVIVSAAAVMPRGVRPFVSSIVVTGNTTMLSFVSGVPVDGLAAVPFKPACLFGIQLTWDELRRGGDVSDNAKLCSSASRFCSSEMISGDTPVYLPPCIGAFLGADTVCAMLSAEFSVPDNDSGEKHPAQLLADVGTNCEIALYVPSSEGKQARLYCTSAAAGPAFEAANISCGMSAVDGAIDRVRIENDAIFCHVIGNGIAKGVCGSGLLSAVAALYQDGSLDKSGTIVKRGVPSGDGMVCIELTPSVRLSQQDIHNLQLAKAAVHTGIQFLLEKSSELPVFYIAGGFGTMLDIDDACTVGLIPRELSINCVRLGNAALAGASLLLFSSQYRSKAMLLAKKTYKIQLAGAAAFQERFLGAIDFD